MPQRPSQHSIHVGRLEGIKRLDDLRGACALLMQVSDTLQADARLTDTQPAVAVVLQRDRYGFQYEVHCLNPPT